METKLGHEWLILCPTPSPRRCHSGEMLDRQLRSQRDSLGSMSPRSESFTISAFFRRDYLSHSRTEEVRCGVNVESPPVTTVFSLFSFFLAIHSTYFPRHPALPSHDSVIPTSFPYSRESTNQFPSYHLHLRSHH